MRSGYGRSSNINTERGKGSNPVGDLFILQHNCLEKATNTKYS